MYADIIFPVEDQLADGDKIVTRVTAHVRQRTTAEPITLIGIHISRIAHNPIVEEWATGAKSLPAGFWVAAAGQVAPT